MWLTYNVSVAQQGDFQLYKYAYVIFQIIFHLRLLQDIDYSSPCYTVNLCCLLHIFFSFFFLLWFFFIFYFLNFKIFNSYMRSQTWTPLPGVDSWEPLGLWGDPTSPSLRSVLNIHWKDWCWSWNSDTLATWWKELTHLKRLWCWERLKAGEKGMTEDGMVGWHHQLEGHEFKWTLGHGGLACCSPWGHKESDTTEWLNWLKM